MAALDNMESILKGMAISIGQTISIIYEFMILFYFLSKITKSYLYFLV